MMVLVYSWWRTLATGEKTAQMDIEWMGYAPDHEVVEMWGCGLGPIAGRTESQSS